MKAQRQTNKRDVNDRKRSKMEKELGGKDDPFLNTSIARYFYFIFLLNYLPTLVFSSTRVVHKPACNATPFCRMKEETDVTRVTPDQVQEVM